MKFYKQPWIGLAFSVFAVGNVYADTVIASKDYVDNAVGAKQDKLTTTNVITSGTGDVVTGVTASDGTVTVTKGSIDVSGAVSDGTNALDLTSSTTKAPSVKAVLGVKSTSALATKDSTNVVTISAGADNKVPTTKAVADTLKLLDSKKGTDTAAVSKVITNVSQTDGQVTYQEGTIGINAIASSAKETNNVVTSTNTTILPTVAGVQAGIVKQGTATADWSTVTSSTEGASAQLKAMETATNRDSYVPTVAAVEKRLSGLQVTSAMIQNGTIAEADIGTGAVTNGKLGADAVTSDKIKNGEVKTNDIADLNVTTGKLAADAVTNAKLADNAVQTENVVDKSLKYQNDMNNPALYDINTGAVPASDVCTKTAPCMLTYYKEGGYVYTRWTPLDADGLSANAATTDKGASI
ncbi:MAG: hypothetical protein KBT14_01875 [Proteobacteria bacterium]|nr:hypothetical protein [Candidatus Enterousia onthequi]